MLQVDQERSSTISITFCILNSHGKRDLEKSPVSLRFRHRHSFGTHCRSLPSVNTIDFSLTLAPPPLVWTPLFFLPSPTSSSARSVTGRLCTMCLASSSCTSSRKQFLVRFLLWWLGSLLKKGGQIRSSSLVGGGGELIQPDLLAICVKLHK